MNPFLRVFLLCSLTVCGVGCSEGQTLPNALVSPMCGDADVQALALDIVQENLVAHNTRHLSYTDKEGMDVFRNQPFTLYYIHMTEWDKDIGLRRCEAQVSGRRLASRSEGDGGTHRLREEGSRLNRVTYEVYIAEEDHSLVVAATLH